MSLISILAYCLFWIFIYLCRYISVYLYQGDQTLSSVFYTISYYHSDNEYILFDVFNQQSFHFYVIHFTLLYFPWIFSFSSDIEKDFQILNYRNADLHSYSEPELNLKYKMQPLTLHCMFSSIAKGN